MVNNKGIFNPDIYPIINLMRFLILIVFFAASASHVVVAGVYRCTDNTGNVSYSQLPCQGTTTSQELNVGRKSSPDELGTVNIENKEVCREVSLMAKGIYPAMKKKKDISHVFKDFGGLNSLTPATINIINYVASFRYNNSMKISRIGNLSYTRCVRNGFGKITAEDFPDWQRSGWQTMDPEIRQQLIQNRYQVQNNNQLKEVCKKYNNMIEIYNKRLSAPMNEHEKVSLESTRDMMVSTRDENCKNK